MKKEKSPQCDPIDKMEAGCLVVGTTNDGAASKSKSEKRNILRGRRLPVVMGQLVVLAMVGVTLYRNGMTSVGAQSSLSRLRVATPSATAVSSWTGLGVVVVAFI